MANSFIGKTIDTDTDSAVVDTIVRAVGDSSAPRTFTLGVVPINGTVEKVYLQTVTAISNSPTPWSFELKKDDGTVIATHDGSAAIGDSGGAPDELTVDVAKNSVSQGDGLIMVASPQSGTAQDLSAVDIAFSVQITGS